MSLFFITMILYDSIYVYAATPVSNTLYSTEFLLDYDPDESAWVMDRFGDMSGNLELRFGNIPSQSIKFDVSHNWFEFGSDINFGQNQLKNAALDNRTSAPLNPVVGQIYYNTLEKQTYIWDGTKWMLLSGNTGHEQNTDIGTTANTFTLNTDNSAGDVVLSFGNTGNSYLKWDITNERFILNRNLRIEGNTGIVGQTYIANDHSAATSNGILNLGRTDNGWERIQFNAVNGVFETTKGISVGGNMSMNGNTFTLDADNTATGQNVSIIANQGTDGSGVLRYNSALKRWEISNNGGTFVALGDAAPQGAAGYTTLFAQTAATTAQCSAGGFIFTSGLDTNRNNVLDTSEVATSATVCNGSGSGTGSGGTGGSSTLAGNCTITQTASYSGSAQYSVALSGMQSYSGNTLQIDWNNGSQINSVSNSNGGSSSWVNPVYLLSILNAAQNFMVYANYNGTPPAGQIPSISSAQIKKDGKTLTCVVNQ